MSRGPHINGGGPLNTWCQFFAMVETKGSSGGVKRTPTFLWRAAANVAPFRSDELRESDRELGATWATFTIRYHRSRIPKIGGQVKTEVDGLVWEIRGVQPVDYSRKKVELTCQAVE